MMINNDNCKITNYFDENIFLYLEEIDLCRRLYQIKKKICLIPSISVEHFGGKSHNPIYSEKIEFFRVRSRDRNDIRFFLFFSIQTDSTISLDRWRKLSFYHQYTDGGVQLSSCIFIFLLRERYSI